MKLLRASVLLASIAAIYADCRSADSRRAISYVLVKNDAKSTASVITRRWLPSVAKCKDFAESKHALAFNFVRPSNDNSREANCILLRCPEISGLRQLANVTGVDYFSAYSKKLYADNSTLFCVEQVGMFKFFKEKENFTNARASCKKNGGVLADVGSDARTRGLAAIIGNFQAYVGLSNEPKEKIWKNEFGNALSCVDYRSWAAGEPSHSRGCVILFQAGRKSDPIWRVVSCSLELPYVCEISRWQPKINVTRMSFMGLPLGAR